jgi:hypothetical protein
MTLSPTAVTTGSPGSQSLSTAFAIAGARLRVNVSSSAITILQESLPIWRAPLFRPSFRCPPFRHANARTAKVSNTVGAQHSANTSTL